MDTSYCLPDELPKMSEAGLVRAVVEYRQAYTVLSFAASSGAVQLRHQVGHALRAAERELRRRGLATAVEPASPVEAEALPA